MSADTAHVFHTCALCAECPPALPARGLNTPGAGINLTPFGLIIGHPLFDDSQWTQVLLPDGWRGYASGITDIDGIDPRRWGHVVDQFGRTRASVTWLGGGGLAWQPLTAIADVRDYTQRAIRDAEPLALDQQWATRARVLAVARAELDWTCNIARASGRGELLSDIADRIHEIHLFIEAVQTAPEHAAPEVD